MVMIYHVNMMMINCIGGISIEISCIVHIDQTVYANYQISFPVDETEIVRYGNHGHSLTQLVKGLIKLFFGSGVDVGSRFIEQQQLRFTGDGAGDKDSLPLTSGKPRK